MPDVLGRLRAALTPKALLALLMGIAALALFSAGRGGAGGETALEARAGRALSGVEGAGRVRVVIATRRVSARAELSGFSGLSGAEAEEIPSGAVAVAEGADDPLVNARLTQALCSLLGLPASAVTVMSGTGGA